MKGYPLKAGSEKGRRAGGFGQRAASEVEPSLEAISGLFCTCGEEIGSWGWRYHESGVCIMSSM
jgi:hypothetical protein